MINRYTLRARYPKDRIAACPTDAGGAILAACVRDGKEIGYRWLADGTVVGDPGTSEENPSYFDDDPASSGRPSPRNPLKFILADGRVVDTFDRGEWFRLQDGTLALVFNAVRLKSS